MWPCLPTLLLGSRVPSAPRLSDPSLRSRALPPLLSLPACAPFSRVFVRYLLCFLPQEELRCRRLELEVEGLTAKVVAADDHRRRLEAMLEGAKRERDEAAAVRCYRFVFVLDDPGRQACGQGERGTKDTVLHFFVLSLFFCALYI